MSSCPIPDINIPGGFRWSAVKAGIKASGRPDLALAEAPLGASAAAVYTTNRVCAAPLVVDKANLKKTHGRLRALLVNAGNANCATGKPGISAANQSCEALGRALEVAPEFIFPSSTGIIGVPLPIEKIIAAIPELVRERASDSASALAFAEAIMTTDTRMKCDSSSLSFVGKHFSILGMAKGSGMIHPNMATMLAYIFTDIEAPPAELQELLKGAVSKTFNAISVDGDTSTNDTVLLMASGASGARLNRGNKSLFVGMLEELCYGLAEDIVRDGEGAKHLVRLYIEQAKNEEEARQIARSIANSPLVKTAWAGSDPNWGRILSSIGKSGVDLDPSRINIFIGPQQVCKRGMANPFDEKAAHKYMIEPAFDIRVQLGRGKAKLNFLTCDLTTQYVHINADYST
jgi:glutamate N-acetyltransferase / amino-acid N-acetyltransferase